MKNSIWFAAGFVETPEPFFGTSEILWTCSQIGFLVASWAFILVKFRYSDPWTKVFVMGFGLIYISFFWGVGLSILT